MRNADWVALSDAQRGQLVSIWLLAADRQGSIPKDPKVIQKLCYMDNEPDLELFISHGFIELDANVTPERRQDDANMTHQTRLDKTRLDKTRNTLTSSAEPSDQKRKQVPYQEIISLYHKTLPELPECKKLTEKRKGYMRARWNDGLPDLETWEKFFTAIRNSKFLMGQTPANNGRSRPFIADLEWMINPSNYVKIYEGKYYE
jgi:hypothetical protein